MTTKFLLVQGNILVTEDLTQILSDCIPASTIRRVKDVPEAIDTLQHAGPQDVVFLMGPAASSTDPAFMDLLAERAITAVRVGVESPNFTEVLYDGYRVAVPFSTGDIERVLGNIGLKPKAQD